jgi:hypothetical protein
MQSPKKYRGFSYGAFFISNQVSDIAVARVVRCFTPLNTIAGDDVCSVRIAVDKSTGIGVNG